MTSRRQRWWGVAVVAAGAASVAVTLPTDPRRPVLVAAGLALVALLVAAVTRWPPAGTGSVAIVTSTVLLGGALEPGPARPYQLAAAALGLLALMAALDRCEHAVAAAGRDGRRSWPRRRPHAGAAGVRRSATAPVTVLRGPLRVRAAPVLGGVGGLGLVAVTGVQDVVPSVAAVVAGLLAVVAALAVAARGHRG